MIERWNARAKTPKSPKTPKPPPAKKGKAESEPVEVLGKKQTTMKKRTDEDQSPDSIGSRHAEISLSYSRCWDFFEFDLIDDIR